MYRNLTGMQILDDVTHYVSVFLVVSIVLGAVALGAWFAMRKKYIKKVDISHLTKVDYSKLVLADATQFARFDDILATPETELGQMAMVAQNDYKYFTCGLTIRGFDLENADAPQIARTIAGMIALTRLFKGQIQVRQFAKPVDLTAQIERHTGEIEEAREKIDMLLEDIKNIRTQTEISINESPNDLDTVRMLDDQLEHAYREVGYYNWFIKERTEIIKRLSGESANSVRTINSYTYLFSYEYLDSEHLNRALDKEERIREAYIKLITYLRSLSGSFAKCNLSVSATSVREFVEMFREQMTPWDASNMPYRHLSDSSIFNPIIDTDSIEEIKGILTAEGYDASEFFKEEVTANAR